MKSVTVYCGSAPGSDPAFAEAARALGRTLAANGIELVYGGGRLGLMGILADAALEAGGRVVGVIPEALVAHEVAHSGVSEMHVVSDMHARKALLTALCDGFIALPGGIGTLDELFEAWTWNALGYHAKPYCLLNVAGFWDGLSGFIDHVVASGFLSHARRRQYLTADDPDTALKLLDEAVAGAAQGVTW
ncbi:MAG: TIGR00730 family Rossman fold protein [Sphingomicrobium sp.]